MKGIIVYSSKTGNTKTMAQAIYDVIKDLGDIEIKEVQGDIDLNAYDFALVGGWIDRADLDTMPRQLVQNTDQEVLGVFATLGAMPDSYHGRRTLGNLEKHLEDKTSLGVYLCPGLVDPEMIKILEGLTTKSVSAEVKEQMIETSYKSRKATEEELQAAGEFFRKNIEDRIF